MRQNSPSALRRVKRPSTNMTGNNSSPPVPSMAARFGGNSGTLYSSVNRYSVVSQSLMINLDETRRVLACEVMRVNSAVRNMIRERQLQQIYSVIQTSKDEGMITMNESLKSLIGRGLIAPEAAVERSPRPKELARMLHMNLDRWPERPSGT